MRRIVLAVLVLLGSTVVALAKDYQSSFKFTFSAPDTWLVMTKTELASNPVFAKADPGIRAQVDSGAVEILYDKATSDDKFADGVYIKRGPKGVIPNDPDALKATCTTYGAALAKNAGRKLAVTTCETREVAGSKTFYVEYEGSAPGTVTMQYQFLRPDGKLLYVTGTCRQSSLDKFRPDFDAIVKSIKFN
jgi:hypothetical protein